MNLSEADLEDGWEVFAPEPGQSADVEPLDMCGASIPEPAAVFVSALFIERGISSQLGSTVAEWDTVDQAESVLEVYETSSAQDCVRERVLRDLDSEQWTPPVGDIEIAAIPLAIGDSGMRVDVVVELESGLPGGVTRIVITQTMIRVGRVMSILEYASGEDPDRDVEIVGTLSRVLAERLHGAAR